MTVKSFLSICAIVLAASPARAGDVVDNWTWACVNPESVKPMAWAARVNGDAAPATKEAGKQLYCHLIVEGGPINLAPDKYQPFDHDVRLLDGPAPLIGYVAAAAVRKR
jgi:hypothetical protein